MTQPQTTGDTKPQAPNFKNRTIWTGDNLPILRGLTAESVDLIYLDPPFNSNRNYAAPVGSKAAGAAFKDTWTLDDLDKKELGLLAGKNPKLADAIIAAGQSHSKGMQSYLTMMAVRLLEMRRVLKPTGSIYLHCDPTASHYLKQVMDCVFGRGNFRNEIVWDYRKVSNSSAQKFLRSHDSILFYAKSQNATYHPTWSDEISPRKQQLIEAGYNTKKQNGQRYLYIYDEAKVEARELACTLDRNTFDKVVYVDASKGNRHTDIFTINWLNPNAKENVGYPTQKPLALLDRIIQASTNKGDVVLDPFAGCATACVSAELLGRQWVGIDLSAKAVELVNQRLEDSMGKLFHNRLVKHRTDIPTQPDQAEVLPRQELKRLLYGEQEGNCPGCKEHFSIFNFAIDHIVPKSKGGGEGKKNKQLLCAACNSLKGDHSMAYLLLEIDKRNKLIFSKSELADREAHMRDSN